MSRTVECAAHMVGKPSWRGRVHLTAAPFALAAGAVLAALASPGRRLAVVVYAVSLTLLFAVSACYHRGPWGALGRAAWRRADHSTILVFIAGTFTPLAVVVSHGGVRALLLGCMWGAAAIGVAVRMLWQRARPGATAWVYVVVGVSAASVIPAVFARAGITAFVLVVAGGVAYLLGAAVYARHRPDPRPAVFGYHEVFHALTVLAATLQYAGVAFTVLGTPA